MDRTETDLLAIAVADLVNVGVFVVDADMRVLNWNGFMEVHSERVGVVVKLNADRIGRR